MACEDFPCCGHEPGCCPDYDGAGRQLNMRCVCGAVLPLGNRVSLCNTCLMHGLEEGYDYDGDYEEDEFDGDYEEDEFDAETDF